MSAAFNLVSKEVIVPKLKLLGVGEFAARLLFSYLTSRQSRVKVKGYTLPGSWSRQELEKVVS